MIVKVVKSIHNQVWYSECINELFFAFKFPDSPAIYFTPLLFFFPDDIEIVHYTTPDPHVPVINHVGIA